MAEVNVENVQGEQFQAEIVLEQPQAQDVLEQPQAQVVLGQPMMVGEFLAEQAQVQAEKAAAVHRQMEIMQEAMKDLTEQAEVSKKLARKVVLDKAVALVKLASSRRSVC